MAVFEYVVVKNPTANEAKDGVQEELVVGPKTVVAKDDAEVKLIAAREPAAADIPTKRLGIFVRPFFGN